jgi:hypothetical protein
MAARNRAPSCMSSFSRDWLRLREAADLASRDPHLARRFAAALPKASGRLLKLLDLAAGSGANCRALMPRIAGDQHWTLIDRDRDLLAAQAEEMVLWARRQGYPVLAGGGRVTITLGTHRWQVESLELDLARNLGALAALDADGVTAAALFDLVAADWLDAFAALLRRRCLPLLAALTVDGGRDWAPPLAEDAIVAAAFRRHQTRDKGFGPALGGAATAHLAAALGKAGWTIAEAASDWHLGARDAALLEALIAGDAEAAQAADPDRAATIAAWQKARQGHCRHGRLRLTVGHRDLLALPVRPANMGG